MLQKEKPLNFHLRVFCISSGSAEIDCVETAFSSLPTADSIAVLVPATQMSTGMHW